MYTYQGIENTSSYLILTVGYFKSCFNDTL